MVRLLRGFVQSLLKLANSVIGMVGMAMILYSIWMITVWKRHMSDMPFDHSNEPVPWFIYTFLGIGVSLCVITCSGHIAAETAHGCCLYLYMFFIFMLLMLEAAVSVDVFLNHNWEEDFPDDPTGNLDRLKEFIKSNIEMCKWIGLSIVSMQGFCILLALLLKALGPHRYYDSDDESITEIDPLLKNVAVSPSYVVGDPSYGPGNNGWNMHINEKAKR